MGSSYNSNLTLTPALRAFIEYIPGPYQLHQDTVTLYRSVQIGKVDLVLLDSRGIGRDHSSYLGLPQMDWLKGVLGKGAFNLFLSLFP